MTTYIIWATKKLIAELITKQFNWNFCPTFVEHINNRGGALCNKNHYARDDMIFEGGGIAGGEGRENFHI